MTTDQGSPLSNEHAQAVGRASVNRVRATKVKAVPSPAVTAPMEFDPTHRSFQINPYPVLAAFRKDAPVYMSSLYNGWFLFRYADVLRICDDKTTISAGGSDNPAPHGLFQLDEDPVKDKQDEKTHTEVLKLIFDAWMPAAATTDALVEKSIKAALGALSGKAEFDLVDEFARPVPREVYFDILGGKGIPPDQRLELDGLARTVMKFHDHLLSDEQAKPGMEAGSKLGMALMALLVKSATDASFEGSFLHRLAPALLSGALNKVAAAKTLVSLTVAGYMSVEFLLATGIRRLLLDKAYWWSEVKAGRADLTDYVLEMHRYEHALAVIDRFAASDIEIGGVKIAAGSRVFGVLASANRDDSVFANGETFQPGRKNGSAHLGLGHGVHQCMGRFLDAATTQPAIAELMKEMPNLSLASDAEPPWFTNFYFRSFDHLVVKRS